MKISFVQWFVFAFYITVLLTGKFMLDYFLLEKPQFETEKLFLSQKGKDNSVDTSGRYFTSVISLEEKSALYVRTALIKAVEKPSINKARKLNEKHLLNSNQTKKDNYFKKRQTKSYLRKSHLEFEF